MLRNQANSSWKVKLAVHVAAGTVAAAVTGALVGAFGATITAEARAATASALALVAIAAGVLEATGRKVPLAQIDRETPQGWMAFGALGWAARNGGTLGVGARTRIGFPLWYAVPAASLLAGSAWVGAGLWGIYGATRTAAALPLVRAVDRYDDFAMLSDTLRAYRQQARRACAMALIGVGLLVLMVVG